MLRWDLRNTNNKNILVGYWNGIWNRKICLANDEKQKKIMERVELPNPEKKTLEKKKLTSNFEYWK